MDGDTLVPTDPTPAPAPDPEPVAPPVDPLDTLASQRKQASPAPAPSPAPAAADPLDDLAEQRQGARRAILTTSMIAAVRGQPEREAKILALNDQLGMSGVVDAKNYDEVHQHTRLQDIDFPRLLKVHPELASWLSTPGNAAIAHDEVPQLQQLSSAAKSLSGVPYDVNGVLPDGFQFLKDGSIRGPLSADGTQPRIYRSIDELRDEFSRENTRRALVGMEYDREHGGQWFPNVGAGLRASIAETLSALSEGGVAIGYGSDRENRRAVRHDAESQLSEAALRDPTLSGGAARIVGSLIGDAPLYLLGGELASATKALSTTLTSVKAATALPASSASAYLADVWQTAIAYSPVAARSGINSGADNGAAYGSVDFLINSLGPAAFGSKLGLAKAIVPGEETAAAAAGWTGVAGRLLVHAGSQGGIMATTELANAIHEVATGVNPSALELDQLLPRLGQAGAMGAVLAGAFHLPGAVGEQIRRGQVAANAAMMHGDRLGSLMEAAEALKTPERSSARFDEMLRSVISDDQRTKFYQGEDFEGIAKAAGMKPEDLAAAMNVTEEYKLALATGKTMSVPTADLIRFGMAHEDPVVKKALLIAARERPDGLNVNEAVQFYKDTPDEIAKQKLDLESDVTKAAAELRETDPIYQDMMGKVADTGRPIDEAKADAKLMAARFNTVAARWNAGAEERGAKRIDPLEEYHSYQLKIQKETPGASGIEPLDALINRLRKGDVPTQRQAFGESLVEFLSKRGLQDVGGELKSMGVDEIRKPGQKNLIDQEGWGLDIAAERAHDAGFLESADPNELLAKIAEEHAGRPVFAFGNEHPQLAPTRQILVELEQLLRSRGIDLQKPNTEIKQALAGDQVVARFEQPVLHAPGESLAFEDLLKQWRKANGDRMPVENSATWKKLVREAHQIDLANGKIYHQPGDEGHRGSIEFDANRHFAMTLTGRANLSTVLHESGHFWLETMGDYAEREGAPKQMADDYAKVLDFLGVKSRGEISTAHHEQFARAIEQYLMEGHAPSAELRGTFQRFAIWLADLYKQFKALVNLTPEVKGVFDRLLATDDAIAQVQKDLGSSTIFKDQEASGMSDQKWGAYLTSIRRERERMQANVFAKAMAVLRKENTKTYHREKSQVIAEASAIVKARPVNVAVSAMAHGLDAAGNELDVVPKLDRREIERDYGKGTISKLPRGITIDEGGMSLQTAAEAFGFRSGEELWTALANYQKPKDAIRELADQIMQGRHPEMTADAMHEAAMEAVHANNGHADILSQESAALAIHALKKPIPQEQMKSIAERVVDGTNYRDLNPNSHLRAEVQASDASTKAFLQLPPDYTGAFLHKQREELSHALYRASLEAQEVVEKTTDLMKRLRKTDTRQMIGRAGGFVITGKNGERLVTLDPGEAQTLAQEYGGTTESFLQAVDRMSEFWEDKGQRYDMDYGALHDFGQEAASIHHQAKSAFDLIVGGKREALAEAITDATRTQGDAVKGAVVAVPRDKKALGYQALTWLRQFDAGNRTLAAICRSLDGEKGGGWHWENINRPLNDAANDEMTRKLLNATEMKVLVKAWGKRGRKDPVYIPAIGEHMNLETRIGVMLNAGSRPNLERMKTGDGWEGDQIAAIIHTLDEKDIELVRGIWDHLQKKWPEISALHSKLTGIPPVKKDTVPVQTRFGTVEGGYYPILYDKDVGARAFELTLDKPTNPMVGKPRAGFTEKTVETTGMKIQYGFDALFRHNDDTAHYLSHAEAADNLNKILNNKMFAQSVVDRFGMPTYQALTERVRNVLEGPRGPQNAMERAISFLRKRSGIATIGYSAMTFVAHGFGVFQNMKRVGAGKYLAAEAQLLQSAGSAESGYRFIDSKSDFMKNSRHGMTPESAERISQGAAGGALQFVHDHALDLLHMALRHINSATWMAEYKTHIEAGETDDRAVALADQAVRDTQGSGQTVDKTLYQDKNEFTKVLMQFASFFTRTYQMMRPDVVGLNVKDPHTIMALAKSTLMLVSLPAVSEAMFMQLVKPEDSDDNSPEWWAKRLAKDHLEYLLSTVILGREFSSLVEGYDYQGPAGMRSVVSLTKAVKSIGHALGDPDTDSATKALRATYGLVGQFFGLPTNQVDKIVRGLLYDQEQGTANPLPLIFGPPRGR